MQGDPAVLRRLIGRLFGFQEEIERLEQQLQDLSWDTAFGMWTRAAFLQFCHVMPRGRRILLFLDLDAIHGMNERYGYEQVNRLVKTTFSVSFRRSDVVARWFSGDEIVILFDSDAIGAERKIAQLQESARQQGLTFKYEVGEWVVGKQAVEDVVEELGRKVGLQKEHGAPQ